VERLVAQLEVLSQEDRRLLEADDTSDEAREAVIARLRTLLTPEDRALRDAAMSAKGDLVLMLMEAATTYNAMRVFTKKYSGAQEFLELIAERWRAAEILDLGRLGTDFLRDEELALLGAIEDSLVLSLSDNEEHRAHRLDPQEVRERVRTVCQELPYADAWNRGWDSYARDAKASLRTQEGWHEAVDDYIDGLAEDMKLGPDSLVATARRIRARRVVTRLLPGRPKRVARIHELAEALVADITEAVDYYQRLAPDGRELTNREQEAVRALLESGAVRLRIVDAEHDLFADTEANVVRLYAELHHALHRSMILTLSPDPERRKLAMPAQELLHHVQQMQARTAALRPQHGQRFQTGQHE
jgi:hypothetical protein